MPFFPPPTQGCIHADALLILISSRAMLSCRRPRAIVQDIGFASGATQLKQIPQRQQTANTASHPPLAEEDRTLYSYTGFGFRCCW